MSREKRRKWKGTDKRHCRNMFPAVCFKTSAGDVPMDVWESRHCKIPLLGAWAPPKPQVQPPTCPYSAAALRETSSSRETKNMSNSATFYRTKERFLIASQLKQSFLIKEGVHWAAPVAQRFSAACSPGRDPGDPGSSPTSGFLYDACFFLCLCLCLSLSLCLYE